MGGRNHPNPEGQGRKTNNPRSVTAKEIRPQEGPQTQFLQSQADIVVYGGAAGGGKTWALLAEPLRHVNNGEFGAVIFRRTYPEIKNEGGLWDEARKMYGGIPGTYFKESDYTIRFPSGARVSLRHMQLEKDKFRFQGSQIPLIEFDELTHFSEAQFFYMMSRNRSTCGVRPYIRASTNPDAASWVKRFLAPWVDTQWRKTEAKDAEEHGRLSRVAESGDVLYMRRRGNDIQWIHPDDSVLEDMDHTEVRSVSFIKSMVTDNRVLMEKDPNYIANLKALPAVERERLLGGNWEVEEGEQDFERDWFSVVPNNEIPYERLKYPVRYWDLASTDRNDPNADYACYTAGVLMAIDKKTRQIYILDVKRRQYDTVGVRKLVIQTATEDKAVFGDNLRTFMEQEPGSSGVSVIDAYKRDLVGFRFEGDRPTGEKRVRAQPLSNNAEAGLVFLRRGAWNEEFLNEAAVYPHSHKDQIDAAAGALTKVSEYKGFAFA